MLMFANVACEGENVSETVCSLRFADKVNKTHIGQAKANARVDLAKVAHTHV